MQEICDTMKAKFDTKHTVMEVMTEIREGSDPICSGNKNTKPNGVFVLKIKFVAKLQKFLMTANWCQCEEWAFRLFLDVFFFSFLFYCCSILKLIYLNTT